MRNESPLAASRRYSLAAGRAARRPAGRRRRAYGDTVDLVVAATTDVHGRLRGWDYLRQRAGHRCAACAAPPPIVDSLRARRARSRRARRRRRPAPGQPAHVRGRARRPDDAAPGHRRDERHALRRGGGRQPRVQLRRRRSCERDAAPGDASPSSRPTRYRPDGEPRLSGVDDGGARRACRSAIVGATTPGSMVWDRDNLRGRRRRRRHRPRGARGGRRRRAPPAPTVVVVAMHSGLDEPVQLRHGQHRRAERERRGARRARGAGHRPDRLRPLAPGDGRHDDQRRRCSCSRRTGRRASPWRT